MNLRKTLAPSFVFPAINASTKDEAITEMVRLLARANGVDEIEPLLTAVLERERKDSTGL
jgi:mannitol/fructose-specific phosphotransferase system IIA component (Ntr-type)